MKRLLLNSFALLLLLGLSACLEEKTKLEINPDGSGKIQISRRFYGSALKLVRESWGEVEREQGREQLLLNLTQNIGSEFRGMNGWERVSVDEKKDSITMTCRGYFRDINKLKQFRDRDDDSGTQFLVREFQYKKLPDQKSSFDVIMHSDPKEFKKRSALKGEALNTQIAVEMLPWQMMLANVSISTTYEFVDHTIEPATEDKTATTNEWTRKVSLPGIKKLLEAKDNQFTESIQLKSVKDPKYTAKVQSNFDVALAKAEIFWAPLAFEAGLEPKLSKLSLTDARKAFKPVIKKTKFVSAPKAEAPPPAIFKAVQFKSTSAGQAIELDGYLHVPATKQATQKRPAVLWLHGGVGGIGSWLWKDYSVTGYFRDAKMVVFCPNRRAENKRGGEYDLFYHELDDTLAALDYLANHPAVDANQIYVAGRDTGATLAVLASLSSNNIKATFAVDPCVELYSHMSESTYAFVPFNEQRPEECYYRSPYYFIRSLKTPVYCFMTAESELDAQNATQLEKLSSKINAPFYALNVQLKDAQKYEHDLLEPIQRYVARVISVSQKTGKLEPTQKALDDQLKLYHAYLARRANAQREAVDLRLLAQTRESLSDFSKPHVFTYYLLARKKAQLETCKKALAKTEKLSDVKEYKDRNGKPYFVLRLSRTLAIEFETIFKSSREVAAIADKHGLMYDNWTAEEIKK